MHRSPLKFLAKFALHSVLLDLSLKMQYLYRAEHVNISV